MPTYLEWDREVLEQCYEYVDAISLTSLFWQYRRDGQRQLKVSGAEPGHGSPDRGNVPRSAISVRGHKRSPKKLWLSFDEWNVWYRARSGTAVDGNRQEAPHLLEEVYNLEDALAGRRADQLIAPACRTCKMDAWRNSSTSSRRS